MLVAALYSKRSTGAGALAGDRYRGVLWILFFARSLAVSGEYTVGGTGLVRRVFLSLTVMSLFTAPPDEAVLARFFP